jgi:hypothetical protein
MSASVERSGVAAGAASPAVTVSVPCVLAGTPAAGDLDGEADRHAGPADRRDVRRGAERRRRPERAAHGGDRLAGPHDRVRDERLPRGLDQGLRGGEDRAQLPRGVRARLPEDGPHDGQPLPADRHGRREDQAAAGRVGGAGLHPDHPVQAEHGVVVGDGAGDRDGGPAERHDGCEGRKRHGAAAQDDLIGRGAGRAAVVSGGVGVVGAGHAEGRGGRVHLRDEGRDAAGVPLGQDPGHVVGGRQHDGLERLALGEDRAGRDRDQGLAAGRRGGVRVGLGRGDLDAGTAVRRAQRVVGQHDVRRHDLGDARDRHGRGRPRGADPADAVDGDLGLPGRGPRQGRRGAGDLDRRRQQPLDGRRGQRVPQRRHGVPGAGQRHEQRRGQHQPPARAAPPAVAW